MKIAFWIFCSYNLIFWVWWYQITMTQDQAVVVGCTKGGFASHPLVWTYLFWCCLLFLFSLHSQGNTVYFKSLRFVSPSLSLVRTSPSWITDFLITAVFKGQVLKLLERLSMLCCQVGHLPSLEEQSAHL